MPVTRNKCNSAQLAKSAKEESCKVVDGGRIKVVGV
jgi:hypothetical protein